MSIQNAQLESCKLFEILKIFSKCFKIIRPREIKIICAKKSKQKLDQNVFFRFSGNSFRIQVQELASFTLQNSRK